MNSKALAVFSFAVALSAIFWMGKAVTVNEPTALNGQDRFDVSFFESSANSQCLPSITISRRLAKGMQGEDIKQLQQFLAAAYVIPTEDIVTGYYGDKTVQWVKELQYDKRLPQSGIVDSATAQAIQEEFIASCTQ